MMKNAAKAGGAHRPVGMRVGVRRDGARAGRGKDAGAGWAGRGRGTIVRVWVMGGAGRIGRDGV